MPIALTPFDHGDLCHGSRWTVEDDDLLAQQIAAVAVGQSRHVEKVLAGAHLGPTTTNESSAAAAIAMLTVDGADPSHRDGWIFQVISWIAAHRATPGGLIRSPHMILADKGFDGLQLELDHGGQRVTAVIIFEDKATANPRDTVRDEVWPAIEALENGSRDNLLTADVVGLLQTQHAIDPDRAIQDVLWKTQTVRHYRVSVTVDSMHGDDAGRLRLFRGYDSVAAGPAVRRRAETLELASLRAWMAQLATKAIRAVEAMVPAHV